MYGPIQAVIRKALGYSTDTASATGNAHAKLSRLIEMASMCEASDALKASSDNQSEISNISTYNKVKEIIVNHSGTIRVVFVLWDVTTNPGSARIYVNGSAAGTERISTDSEVTHTEDIAVSAGDKVQLYLKASGTSVAGCRVKNFRVYFDMDSSIEAMQTYHIAAIS